MTTLVLPPIPPNLPLLEAYNRALAGGRAWLEALGDDPRQALCRLGGEQLTDRVYYLIRELAAFENGACLLEGLPPEEEAPEFINRLLEIIGVCGIALLKSAAPEVDLVHLKRAEILERLELHFARCRELMLAKNHDYGDSWKHMRIPAITDQMRVKAQRIIQLEELAASGEAARVSEGRDSELRDIINYACFELLKFLWPASAPEPLLRKHTAAAVR